MEDNLATEIMHELKASANRWFKAFVIMAILEVITIAAFIIYCSLPTETSSTTVEQEANDTDNTNLIGGDYNGQILPESDQNILP